MTTTAPAARLSDTDLAARGWAKDDVRRYGRPRATRYALLGINVTAARHLASIKVKIDRAERFTKAGMPWDLVAALHDAPGIQAVEDLTALLVMVNTGLTDDDIRAWGRIGSLDAAYRLITLGVTVTTAAQIPLHEGELRHLLKMTQRAQALGVRVPDLTLWVTGGALTTEPPYVRERVFTPWRSVGVHEMGMRRAALACAAGMSPDEAAAMYQNGDLDELTLRTLASLRRPTGR